MEQFLKEGGHVLHAVFLAFKGSRFNWHLTAGKAFLLNHAWPLYELKTKYPEVRVSAMDDIRKWIDVGETGTVKNRT